MKIQLNKNSWYFKYYSSVISDRTPKTLCPYFWTMVTLIVLSPVLIPFMLGVKISKMIPKKKPVPKKSIFDMTNEELDTENKRLGKVLKRSEIVGKIVMTTFGLFIASLLIISFYLGAKKVGWFEVIRNLFSLIGIWSVMYFTITFLLEHNVGSKVSKMLCGVSNKNIIRVSFEMVKSFYTKACPIINWK